MAMDVTSRSVVGGRPDKAASYKEIQQEPSPRAVKSISRARFSPLGLRLMRRNFSSRAPELSGGKAIILSVPKSGRTWVRTFLCAYFCKRHGREFTLEPERYREPGIPRLIFSHDLFEHRTKGGLWDRIRGKYLVPRKELRRAKIILVVRDPRDCFVSLYVQMTRRDPGASAKFKEKTVSDLLRDKGFGIRAIVKTMNDWLNEFSGRDDFTQFENMKKMEAAGAFDSKILRPGDVRDPESFKVRRGKVGGYREYLSVEDQDYASAALTKLDPRLGYALGEQRAPLGPM